jgi:hypothetical protein
VSAARVMRKAGATPVGLCVAFNQFCRPQAAMSFGCARACKLVHVSGVASLSVVRTPSFMIALPRVCMTTFVCWLSCCNSAPSEFVMTVDVVR